MRGDSFFRIGAEVRHLASHNRYQIYKVLDVAWDPEAMMGAGCYIYTIDFYEYSDSAMRNLVISHQGWRIAEVTLPIHNLVPWGPKEV